MGEERVRERGPEHENALLKAHLNIWQAGCTGKLCQDGLSTWGSIWSTVLYTHTDLFLLWLKFLTGAAGSAVLYCIHQH